MTPDPWTLGHEAVAIIDDLRKAGRLTALYEDALVWHAHEKTVGLLWGVEELRLHLTLSPADHAWRHGRANRALDLEHPATKGILLAYVREASGRVALTDHHRDAVVGGGVREWWTVEDGWSDRALGGGDTEGEALVAALRALRDGGP